MLDFSALPREESRMPTAVEVSSVKRGHKVGATHERIEGLGGIWRDRPWYMSSGSVITEIERPANRRQWDFYVQVGDRSLPVIVTSTGGRKYLTTPGDAYALLKLPELPQERDCKDWSIFS
jgi:hypothetical protein